MPATQDKDVLLPQLGQSPRQHLFGY